MHGRAGFYPSSSWDRRRHPHLVSGFPPVVRTFYISLFDRDGPEFGEFVGLMNYVDDLYRSPDARGVSQ